MTIKYEQYMWDTYKLPGNTTVTIDAFHRDEKKDIIEASINDPREDITESSLSEEARDRQNAEFIYCAVNNALFAFVVATRDIAKGEQIFVFYGPGYTRSRLEYANEDTK